VAAAGSGEANVLAAAGSTNSDTLGLAESATCWLLRSRSVPAMKRGRRSLDMCNAAELPAPSTEFWARATAWVRSIWFTPESLDRCFTEGEQDYVDPLAEAVASNRRVDQDLFDVAEGVLDKPLSKA